MSTRRGKQEKKAAGLKLRVELIDGNKIIDDLEVADVDSEREGKDMLDALQETLEEDFDCDFGGESES